MLAFLHVGVTDRGTDDGDFFVGGDSIAECVLAVALLDFPSLFNRFWCE